jgi:molybdenum cofactor cytidylyltransferase
MIVVVGILLAAGRGRRFDPSGARNKLLHPIAEGEAIVVASARKLLAAVPRVVAVVRPEDGGVTAALRALGCDVTVCIDADRGMTASLIHGLRRSPPDADAWIIALGDMPHVQPATLRALVDALAHGAQIAAPVCGGVRGNPVGFARRHLAALLSLSGDRGARSVLEGNPVTQVAVDDPGIFLDIDTLPDVASE